MSERRNVLVILADQLQAFALGCAGHPDIATPHLDALAAQGTHFTQAYVEYAVCTQYRGVLHTGRYGSQTGITDFGQGPTPGTECLAHALAGLGKHTSYVGKWHLYEFFDGPVRQEHRCGFEHFIGNQSFNGYYEGTRFWDEQLTPIDFVNIHRTTATADVAIDRLRAVPADDDFALLVSFLNPHYPLEPLDEYLAMYRDVDITLRPNVVPPARVFTPTFSPESPRPIEHDPNFHRYGHSIEAFWSFYAAMVSHLDHEVGRILAELDALGRADDTFVVFTSDHGEMGGSHGRMNKRVWQEESTRVPFIVRSPGAPPARIATPISAGIDVWPTLVDWLADAADPSLPGGSLMPMVAAGAPLPHHPVIAELAEPDGYVMVREGNWKHVESYETDIPIALHHLGDDPFEQTDVGGDHPDERLRLAALAADWRALVGQS